MLGSMFDNVGAVVTANKPEKTVVKTESVWDKSFNEIFTNEDSRSYFTTIGESGKPEIACEGVKSFVLDKLYGILSTKISKMDVEYQEIIKTSGSYKKYSKFKLIDDTVKSLKELTISGKTRVSPGAVEQIDSVLTAHENLVKCQKDFEDAFRFNIAPVKQYYLAVVSSVIYSLGFIVTSMIDYDQRDGNASYDAILKNENILERGMPKNMMNVICQFNEDAKHDEIKKTVSIQKKAPVTTEALAFTTAAIVGGVAIGIMALPAIIRYIIYFFMHSKVKLSEYFEAQACYLEINAGKLEYKKNVKDAAKIAEKQMKYVEKLHKLAAIFSGDKYSAEKEADKEVKLEDKELVKAADESEMKSSRKDYSESDILL